ncbi:Uncharacterised protein [Chlamydia trachomatis]|nr:Uncharacterised protein [Chlamydia trachomatis]
MSPWNRETSNNRKKIKSPPKVAEPTRFPTTSSLKRIPALLVACLGSATRGENRMVFCGNQIASFPQTFVQKERCSGREVFP